MTDRATSEQRFADAVQAATEVERWATGAHALALLTAVHQWGWTRYLSTPREIERLAEFTGLPRTRLEDVLEALKEHGVVERNGSSVCLSPLFAALAAEDAWLALPDVLDHAETNRRLIHGAVQATAAALLAGDALVAARAAGGRATTVTSGLYEQLLADLPEWTASLREARLLDVGCGVATSAITVSSAFPGLRTTAIEVVPEVAAEARRRVNQHGLTDRIDVRCVDARDLAEDTEFDSAFWAQQFFPERTRAATLAMIRRALRPGGLLIVPEEDAGSQDMDQRSRSLRKLLRGQRHAPLDRSATQLAAEAQAAGFALVRVAPTSFGSFVLLRRPADPSKVNSVRR
ncbi:class I SAM-dependent methyltransferase [Actinoplanes sp. NPDC048796]|uniref:SAM-dependent methyltransferase n=1 Tax=unclassified Actinoplanes TaxID=2626549 RepID=UPI0033D86007